VVGYCTDIVPAGIGIPIPAEHLLWCVKCLMIDDGGGGGGGGGGLCRSFLSFFSDSLYSTTYGALSTQARQATHGHIIPRSTNRIEKSQNRANEQQQNQKYMQKTHARTTPPSPSTVPQSFFLFPSFPSLTFILSRYNTSKSS